MDVLPSEGFVMSCGHSPARWLSVPGVVVVLFLSGCSRGRIDAPTEGPTEAELVKFYSPARIKILPFTKPRSFDDDLIPDGIAVSLRPLDSGGDPVKAYGTFIFELYTYKPGLASRRGELLQSWTQVVRDAADQKRFWERVTSTYEFQLSWEGRVIPAQKRYILIASFQSGGGERLFDEYQFDFRLNRDDVLTEAGAEKKPG